MPPGRNEPKPHDRDEDELDELPPLDGDVRDEPEPGAPADDLEDDASRPSDASLDDATGENDPVDANELGVDEGEGGWLDEPAESPDLDLGDVAIVDFAKEGEASLDEPEEATRRDARDEDIGFGQSPERGDLDGGEEGPLDADDDLKEADLPDLDADAEGDVDDGALVDPGFAADEPLGLQWAAAPWSLAGAPVALVAATAVACAGRGALAAGRSEGGTPEMVRVDLEGTTQVLVTAGLDVARIGGLAVEGDRVAAIVEGGRVFLSTDGGATYAPLPDAGADVAQIAWAAGALWMRTRAGALRSFFGASVETHALAGPVATIANDRSRTIAALLADRAGAVSALVRSRAAEVGEVALEHEEILAVDPLGQPPLLAVRGEHAAYAGRRGVVRRRANGTWGAHAWQGRITAVAFIDDRGTLIAATYADADDTTTLVRLDPDAGGTATASVVARIGPSPVAGAPSGGAPAARAEDDGGDGRVLALAFDDARGVVWVAGGFGVAAYAVR